jgi:hypothetical protein
MMASPGVKMRPFTVLIALLFCPSFPLYFPVICALTGPHKKHNKVERGNMSSVEKDSIAQQYGSNYNIGLDNEREARKPRISRSWVWALI